MRKCKWHLFKVSLMLPSSFGASRARQKTVCNCGSGVRASGPPRNQTDWCWIEPHSIAMCQSLDGRQMPLVTRPPSYRREDCLRHPLGTVCVPPIGGVDVGFLRSRLARHILPSAVCLASLVSSGYCGSERLTPNWKLPALGRRLVKVPVCRPSGNNAQFCHIMFGTMTKDNEQDAYLL